MTPKTVRRLSRIVAAAISAAVPVLFFALPASAAASGGGPILTPDPELYCLYGYELPINPDGGFSFSFDHLQGDPGQNDWKCIYDAGFTVPVFTTEESEDEEEELGSYDLAGDLVRVSDVRDAGPFVYHDWTVGVDWALMCQQQYPGSTLTWVGSGSGGPYGAPWTCVGQPGVSYTPAP